MANSGILTILTVYSCAVSLSVGTEHGGMEEFSPQDDDFCEEIINKQIVINFFLMLSAS